MTVWRKLMTGLLISAVMLTLLNVVCGFIVRDTHTNLDTITTATIDRSHTIFLPNQSKRLLFPGQRPYRATTNNLGLRGPDLPAEKPADAFRVLCLGDSFTFGTFVNDDDTYPWQLQQLLDPTLRAIQILNAGVGGTTISDHLDYVRRRGMDLDPDLLVVQVYCNDLHEIVRNTIPHYQTFAQDHTYAGVERIIRRIKRTQLYRTFVMAEVHWMYFHDVQKMADARHKRILHTQSRDRDDIIYARKREEESIVQEADDPKWQENWDRYFAGWDAFLAYARTQRVPVVAVLMPDVLTTLKAVPPTYLDRIEAYLRRQHVPVVNMLHVAWEYPGDPLDLFNQPPRDYHLSRKGYELVAQRLALLVLETRLGQ